jgi:hypothetical protein
VLHAESPHPHARAAKLALSFRADRAATELFGRLGTEGIEAILLRGPAIAARLYDDGERAYADSDVLVHSAAKRALEDILRDLGYATYIPLGEHWRRAADGAEIDLHVEIFGARAPNAELWARMSAHGDTIELAGSRIPALDPAGTAAIVALHAAHHGAAVPHTLEDLQRALARFALPVWQHAATLAGDIDALVAFRQGLSMLAAGAEQLDELGLHHAVSIRSSLRRRGIELPYYLTEALTPRERAAILRHRLTPSRMEMAATIDTRAAGSTLHLLAVHARRAARLARRALRLTTAGWRAYRDTAAFRRNADG